MKANKLKEIWSKGGCVLNGWLSIPNAFSAEIMAAQGYDSIGIDMQHGIVDYPDAVGMLQAMRASEVMPLVRPAWLDPAQIMKALDAGAYGVICPMINSPAEAEQLVSYVRYPPTGIRSYGPSRALISTGSGNYLAEADDEIVCFAMIETAQALERLDEIATTPGLDGIYIGPADLTIGLTGKKYAPGFDREEPEIIDAIDRILRASHNAGIKAALHCGSASYAAKASKWGFDLVTVSNDVRLLAGAAAASVSSYKSIMAEEENSSGTAKGGY